MKTNNMEQYNPSNFTILMVDDTPKNLQVLGNTLKNENYKLEFATNGIRAIEWLEKKKFDLILLDVMMPEMSGFEVCEHIRKDENYNDLPIIFLTAKTDKESIVKGFTLGAQDYVTKPFDTKELLARVKTQLDLKQKKEKLASINKLLEQKVEERTAELNNAYAKLEIVNEELQNLDSVKNDFLRMISHELRTPLNGILGPLDLLKNKIESEETMQLITLLEKSVAVLEEYSITALKITELKSLQPDLKTDEIDLKELLEFCIIEQSNQFNNKNVSLNINHNDNFIKINGDYDNLTEFFKILLNNLLAKYNNEGEVIIDYSNVNNSISINVNCINIDISLKDLSQLFEQTTNKDKNNINPPMDIYLAKLILIAHRGEINISEKDDSIIINIIFSVS